jgi:hypothetical protein
MICEGEIIEEMNELNFRELWHPLKKLPCISLVPYSIMVIIRDISYDKSETGCRHLNRIHNLSNNL